MGDCIACRIVVDPKAQFYFSVIIVIIMSNKNSILHQIFACDTTCIYDSLSRFQHSQVNLLICSYAYHCYTDLVALHRCSLLHTVKYVTIVVNPPGHDPPRISCSYYNRYITTVLLRKYFVSSLRIADFCLGQTNNMDLKQ